MLSCRRGGASRGPSCRGSQWHGGEEQQRCPGGLPGQRSRPFQGSAANQHQGQHHPSQCPIQILVLALLQRLDGSSSAASRHAFTWTLHALHSSAGCMHSQCTTGIIPSVLQGALRHSAEAWYCVVLQAASSNLGRQDSRAAGQYSKYGLDAPGSASAGQEADAEDEEGELALGEANGVDEQGRQWRAKATPVSCRAEGTEKGVTGKFNKLPSSIWQTRLSLEMATINGQTLCLLPACQEGLLLHLLTRLAC